MIIAIGFLIFIFSCLLYLFLYQRYRKDFYTLETIPPIGLALVPGAGLEKDNTPSDILKDRLISMAEFQNINLFEKIILSGASGANEFDETLAMEKYLLSKDVPYLIIERDPNGFSTYHSLSNYRHTFSKKKFVFVSQHFHLTRALFLAELLDLDCIGLISENISFSCIKHFYWYLREIIAIPYNIVKFFFMNSK